VKTPPWRLSYGVAADPDDAQEVLAFAAEHRLVLETQVRALLDASATRGGSVVRSLAEAGHLTRRELFAGQPAYCQIRRSGLAAIGCQLPVPRLKLSEYKHDVGLAWLWLAARWGRFGPLAEVLGERRLRSLGGVDRRGREACGIRLGGLDRWGAERLHHPDLLLIDRYGRRLALELELTRKDSERLDAILDAYAADPRIDAVLYLAEDSRSGRSIARAVATSARRGGLTERVHVQLVEPLGVPAAEEPAGPARGTARRMARGAGGRAVPGVAER
jgi:hypothetical protein